jgi:hypothetical protein
LVFLLALWWLAFLMIRERGFLRRNWSRLLIFLAAATIVAGPQMLYFKAHPDQFMTRMNQVGILHTGWLANQSAAQNVNPLTIVVGHLASTCLVYISLPATLGFYNAPIPLLSFIPSMLFIFGLTYSMARLLDRRHFLLASWFWAVIVAGGVLTIDPPWHRLLLAAPAVCLWLALALIVLIKALCRLVAVRRLHVSVVAVVVLGAIMLKSASFYFKEYIPGYYFVDTNSERAHVIGYYLRRLGGDYVAFFAGAPIIFIGFPSIPYLAPEVRGVDIQKPVTPVTVPSLPRGKHAVFLAIPERRHDLEVIRRRYPSGQDRVAWSRVRPEPLFFAYEVLNPKLSEPKRRDTKAR